MKQGLASKFHWLVLGVVMLLGGIALSSCKVSYGLSEKVSSIPDSVKTVRIVAIGNRAPYVNPQLTPALTERLRLRIQNQTKLTITNNETAQWTISGEIRDYSVSTTGVSPGSNGQQQSSINRLTVSVHITINKGQKTDEYDVSRSFDFSARQSLQTAEATLLDEMVRNLSDEIFNRLFSDW